MTKFPPPPIFSFPGTAAAAAAAPPPSNKVPIQDASTLAQLAETAPGCCIAVLRDEDASALGYPTLTEYRLSHENAAIVAAAPLALACWKGKSSLNVLITKADGTAMMDRLVDRMKERGLGDAVEDALASAPWNKPGTGRPLGAPTPKTEGAGGQ